MTILLWAAGLAKNWATSKIGKFIFTAYNDESLEGKLSKAVESWLKKNDLNDTLTEAIFSWYHKEAADHQPFRKQLAETVLNENRIPPDALWKGALLERYNEVRSLRNKDEYLQSLFELPESGAEKLFDELAKTLHRICTQNLNLYTVTTHQALQQILADINRLLTHQPSGNTISVLHNFSDFLNDRRVLYLAFNVETKYPLIAMTKSIAQIRERLVMEVVPALPINSDERDLANKMAETCRLFNNDIMDLPDTILYDEKTRLYNFPQNIVTVVENALVKFRRNFTQPMFWMLTQFKVNIPDGILKDSEVLSKLTIPSIIYVQGIPVRSDKSIYYAGDADSGYFLRICTLAQDVSLHGTLFPANTELIFYDPNEVSEKHKIWKVIVNNDSKIKDREWKKGQKFYFDKQDQVYLEDPVSY